MDVDPTLTRTTQADILSDFFFLKKMSVLVKEHRQIS
jgi:hypothetical protein